MIRDVENLHNKIVSELLNITDDQGTVLRHVFEKFKDVQELIDPNRLRDFSYTMTEDYDLVLSRNNELEVINLIIHPEADFPLPIIHKEKGS
ncbi:hypothetical protein GCM10011516_14790 [Sphingobacterium cellulitidis]|uniref:Uncharacterized protein n=1 Tax=Sphingobacterium cellulitidis TaxID=1768011 RepID=A0A8H9FY47_9SPHI|nr:hypothetical protein GCM10011516_14790 [Sphingobacterium soli]